VSDAGAVEPSAPCRISDAASRFGVSPRTLRYYEELGIVAPSSRTPGGERRYSDADLDRIGRILELREIGMNLDEIKSFLGTEERLAELKQSYRSSKSKATRAARAEQRRILEEALGLNQSLAGDLDAKLARLEAFRASLAEEEERCRRSLQELA
jgi:DNA-binding transcriptional MerR regulator